MCDPQPETDDLLLHTMESESLLDAHIITTKEDGDDIERRD